MPSEWKVSAQAAESDLLARGAPAQAPAHAGAQGCMAPFQAVHALSLFGQCNFETVDAIREFGHVRAGGLLMLFSDEQGPYPCAHCIMLPVDKAVCKLGTACSQNPPPRPPPLGLRFSVCNSREL